VFFWSYADQISFRLIAGVVSVARAPPLSRDADKALEFQYSSSDGFKDEGQMSDKSEFIELTADIVAAYVGKNSVPAVELPSLIKSIHDAISGISTGQAEVAVVAQAPAVSVRKSINPDFLICLEDGRRFKSLKRHLRTKYNLSPEDYRAKWGLAKDYPMVAPNYAAARSALAKSMGLGQGGRQAPKPKLTRAKKA